MEESYLNWNEWGLMLLLLLFKENNKIWRVKIYFFAERHDITVKSEILQKRDEIPI